MSKTLESIIASVVSVVKPAEKLTVSQWAAKYRYINMPGAHVGLWSADKTPYMVEPMDVLSSLDYTAMVFVGPARTGKSDAFFNWAGYTAHNDPADMLLYGMTQSRGQEIGKGVWTKFVNAKRPDEDVSLMNSLLRPGKQNIFDKEWANGTQLMIRWPSITELSGKTVPRVWMEDYDRIQPDPDDIDKQGSAFDLARKRTTTYKRFAMTGIEASPGFEITNPNWIAATPHEAPPTRGILGVYNRGDRRRWFWRCPDCEDVFEPTFDLLSYPDDGDNLERAEQTTLVCPHCGCVHGPEKKSEFNRGGKWLREGEVWNKDGSVSGKPRRSDIASFWMQGPAAGFQDWKGLVLSYLDAMDEYERSGNLGPLKKTMNTDQGVPFVPPRNEMARLPETLKARAEDWGGGNSFDDKDPVVPDWVRFLVATVDVQARSFVVQITGIGEFGEMTLVDMFKVRYSDRIDENDIRRPLLPIDPAGYLEDWDLLISEVIERSYPLADGSGRRMPIKITGCDSGGREGVTANAYNFWRKLRDDKDGRNHHRRFHLVKGESKPTAPRRRTGRPDSNQRGAQAIARGDVPVQFFNSNLLKDQLNTILMRDEPGGARFRFPIWAPNFFYTQICAEERTAKGWTAPSGRRNEAWDLSYYCIGLCLHPDINLERITWEDPDRVPGWAKAWDQNDFLMKSDQVKTFVEKAVDPAALSAAASEWV